MPMSWPISTSCGPIFWVSSRAILCPPLRDAYQGVMIGNVGYSAEEAEQVIATGQLDAVAFGMAFLANPDLPTRFAKQAELNAPDASTFYSAGAAGYTDYPYLTAA